VCEPSPGKTGAQLAENRVIGELLR
jgi:hypothetical protein